MDESTICDNQPKILLSKKSLVFQIHFLHEKKEERKSRETQDRSHSTKRIT